MPVIKPSTGKRDEMTMIGLKEQSTKWKRREYLKMGILPPQKKGDMATG